MNQIILFINHLQFSLVYSGSFNNGGKISGNRWKDKYDY
jgi:hypothetical protein